MESNLGDFETIKGGDKWMLILGWSCFVGIAAIVLADLLIGTLRVLSR